MIGACYDAPKIGTPISKEIAMPELKLYVPTYLRGEFRTGELPDDLPDFGEPMFPVVIREADGVRIVLGSHDYWNSNVPDVQLERRPGGWAIFLHPVGGSDPSGYVYFLDDGRSYLVPERGFGPTPPIAILASYTEVPQLDDAGSAETPAPLKPCEICEARPEDQMDSWSGLCPDCDQFVTSYLDFKGLPFTQRAAAIEFLKSDPAPVESKASPSRGRIRRRN
jgi:hypothetical protein